MVGRELEQEMDLKCLKCVNPVLSSGIKPPQHTVLQRTIMSMRQIKTKQSSRIPEASTQPACSSYATPQHDPIFPCGLLLVGRHQGPAVAAIASPSHASEPARDFEFLWGIKGLAFLAWGLGFKGFPLVGNITWKMKGEQG